MIVGRLNNTNNRINFGYRSALEKYAVHCAYCGKKMIPKDKIHGYAQNVTQLSGEPLQKELGMFLDFLGRKPKRLAKVLIEETQKTGESAAQIIKKLQGEPDSDDAMSIIRKHRGDDPATVMELVLTAGKSSIEHVIPHSKKGADTEINYLYTHSKCNGDRDCTKLEEMTPFPTRNIVNSLKEVIQNAVEPDKQLAVTSARKLARTVRKETGHKVNLKLQELNVMA